MLGQYVYKVLTKDYSVVCIKRDIFDIEKDSWHKLESSLITLEKDDIVINCAGTIPQKVSLTDYRQYIRVNTLFPHKLNEISKVKNAKFIHITTDCVFDGLKGSYTENDKHTATNIYGISKSEGEPEDATIIRTSIIGEEVSGKKSLLEWVKSKKNGKINGYKNHYWNGITCLTLANFIKNIIDDNNFWKGIRHVFSPDIVSKYDLCCYINEIYDLNIDIESYEDLVSKNMTLTGNNKFITSNIYDQIKEQYKFKFYS